MRHWSGAANTEAFIEMVVSEPHPLDKEPTMCAIRKIQEEQALAMALDQLQKQSQLATLMRRSRR